MANGQFAGVGNATGGITGGGAVQGVIPGTPFGGIADPSLGGAREGVRLIPSILIGERYDSNVYFTTETPGLDKEDFVTTVVPQIRGMYSGELMSLSGTVSAVGETYVKNSNLNYVGSNADVLLDASKLLSSWRRGSRLTVAERYSYTPQAPAFLTGSSSVIGGNPLITGYQVGRVNTQTNYVRIDSETPLNEIVRLKGYYGYSFVNYGQSKVSGTSGLFDVAGHTYGAGITMQFTSLDQVSFNFAGSQFNYTPASAGSFSTNGGVIEWIHLFKPTLSLYASVGGQLIESDVGGVRNAAVLEPTGTLGVEWKDKTTTISLAYGLSYVPSFQFQSSVLRAHIVSLTFTQVTPIPELVIISYVGYAKGDSLGSTQGADISYVSYTGTGGLIYKVTPKTFLGLICSYSNFDNTFGQTKFAFDRSTTQFTITRAF